ncbi:hypothetical protein BC835DRAFT_1307663 [Cytidiella melzeri]|nr:hypothetical protein BC835DRAFT_1307663 [Cytidiella melzeri]
MPSVYTMPHDENDRSDDFELLFTEEGAPPQAADTSDQLARALDAPSGVSGPFKRAPKVIQLGFKPDGEFARNAEPEPPTDWISACIPWKRRDWKEGELTMEELGERGMPTPGDGDEQLDTVVDPASPKSENGDWVLITFVSAQGALHNAENSTANGDPTQDSSWVHDAGILDKNLDPSSPRSA